MKSSSKFKFFSITSATLFVGIITIASVLTGATYKYNYKRYLDTNTEKVIEISNSNNSRIINPEPSPDSAYYTIKNDYSVDNPRSNDSIDFGQIFTWRAGSQNTVNFIPYNSSLERSILNSYNNNYIGRDFVAINFFGTKSSMYKFNHARIDGSDDQSYYRYPTGFITYPDIAKDASINDNVNKNTTYKFAYRNAVYDDSLFGNSGSVEPNRFPQYTSGDEKYVGGTWKSNLGYSPGGFKEYGEFYDDSLNFWNNANFSMTGARTFDIYGNPLSEFSNTPSAAAFAYINQSPGGIRYTYAFTPQGWYLKDLTKNEVISNYATNLSSSYRLLVDDIQFVNYLDPNVKPDANNIHSVSMTITTKYRNTNVADMDNKKTYAYPTVDYYSPSGNSNLKQLLEWPLMKQDGFNSVGDNYGSIPRNSTSEQGTGGLYFGSAYVANVTFSLTPIDVILAGSNTHEIWYVPLMYSGTTKYSLKAVVENEDRSYTPLEYATKALYAKGSVNDYAAAPDADADFKVNFMADGYPGCEYGSTNRLFLNNVAGTVRWEYNPGTVLKNGLIKPATDEDIRDITIGGFKRIPGVTKIADSIDTQSIYTLAQDLIKEPYKIYKLIYDLGIANLPNAVEYIGNGNWNANTLDNLKTIMNVDVIGYSNIGDKTADGYPQGGYIDVNVSLKLYYNEHTNLILPNTNQPTLDKQVRLYNFKHVEPTRIPDKPIYIGDSSITANQAVDAKYQESIKQSIIQGLTTPVTPTFDNDFRTSEGGTLPVTPEIPDFSKQISFVNLVPNNLEGTVTATVILNSYYDEIKGELKTTGFEAVTITITGYKKVQPTKLNATVTIETDKTANEAIDQNFVANGQSQYPYIQYLLSRYKNSAFTGLPEGFNAGSILIDSAIANNIEGTVTAQVSVYTYYDAAGNLIDLTKGNNNNQGPAPLGTIVIKGFKKISPTALKNDVISVIGDLEFYNTLATQVDLTKIASLIFENKDNLFTSYPGLQFSINSIKILDVYADNLNATINVSFALTQYYDANGTYIEAGDDQPDQWLRFDGTVNKPIKIIGFTQVKPTEFVTTEFDSNFKPKVANSDLLATTFSSTNKNKFDDFIAGNNSSGKALLGGTNTTPFEITKQGGKISLDGVERSAWEILQLSTKTIFQVNPNDIAYFVLRILQYGGMQNYGLNIKLSDISVRILTERNQTDIVNSSNFDKTKDWYTGSLEVEVTIQLADAIWTKQLKFIGNESNGGNVFNRYVPLPIFSDTNGSGTKNLATEFSETAIEQFIFQNIDQIINGSFDTRTPSGKPVNFSNFNISISNIFYNNNSGTISVLLTIDNFYLASGNLSTEPVENIDGANSPKTMSTTLIFKGFKQQPSTNFRSEINLNDAGANSFIIPDLNNWQDIEASKFWTKLNDGDIANYDKFDFIYDLIMGGGRLQISDNDRLLIGDNATIPTDFSKANIVGVENAGVNNINGRINLQFKIVNYYDLYGNLDLTTPKTISVSIFGFKTTQASILAGSSITQENLSKHEIYINGSYNTTASLVTPEYILKNILSSTSGLWPGQDENGENKNYFDFVGAIENLQIISANNSSGKVTASFFVKDDINIYDSEGNLAVIKKGAYTLYISGFESSLLIYIGISILIIFILLILLPTIIILIKRSRVKKAARGSLSDFQ